MYLKSGIVKNYKFPCRVSTGSHFEVLWRPWSTRNVVTWPSRSKFRNKILAFNLVKPMIDRSSVLVRPSYFVCSMILYACVFRSTLNNSLSLHRKPFSNDVSSSSSSGCLGHMSYTFMFGSRNCSTRIDFSPPFFIFHSTGVASGYIERYGTWESAQMKLGIDEMEFLVNNIPTRRQWIFAIAGISIVCGVCWQPIQTISWGHRTQSYSLADFSAGRRSAPSGSCEVACIRYRIDADAAESRCECARPIVPCSSDERSNCSDKEVFCDEEWKIETAKYFNGRDVNSIPGVKHWKGGLHVTQWMGQLAVVSWTTDSLQYAILQRIQFEHFGHCVRYQHRFP